MKQVNQLLAFLVFATLFFTSSCVSLTGFSTGRTTERESLEISGNLTRVETLDFSIQDTLEILPEIRFPVAELKFRYGIIDRLDIGIQASTSANIMADAKYQFVGTQESPLAMAIGLGIGFTPLVVTNVLNIQIPLSVSFHPTEKIHAYVTPRYIFQTAGQVAAFIGTSHYTGFNAGVLFGKEFKFGFDVGNYRLRGDGGETGLEYDRKNLFNVGIGMSYTFGLSGNKEKKSRMD